MIATSLRHVASRLTARAALGLALGLAFSSCSTVDRPTAGPLEQARTLLKTAGSPSRDADRFVAAQLQAAQIASAEPASPEARAIIDEATLSLAEWAVTSGQVPGKKSYPGDGGTYSLTISGKGDGTFAPGAFSSIKPASKVPHKLVSQWKSRSGLGVPLAAQWKWPATSPLAKFVSPMGYAMPVTVRLDVSRAGSARLDFLDPTTVRRVRTPRGESPLAADFSAPIVDRTRNVREVLLAIEGLIRPDVRDAQLLALQPYDPDKIPVILIHGLVSHPRMWKNVINDLTADPAISARYQFWVYYYPSGWPISYSAMRLREDLAQMEKAMGRPKKFVLVGHSMGGILARMQAVSPGDAMVRANIPKEKWAQFSQLPADHIARKTFVFRANPNVERLVFICTPHRGSTMADWSVSTWFTKFVHMPAKITSAAVDLLPSLVKSPEQYASISRLSPKNPLYKVLESLPIQAPHHSIIGDRGKADSPNSTDGVVAYKSSHLETARSEVIVPANHGAFDNPAAIAELRRILLENLRSRH